MALIDRLDVVAHCDERSRDCRIGHRGHDRACPSSTRRPSARLRLSLRETSLSGTSPLVVEIRASESVIERRYNEYDQAYGSAFRVGDGRCNYTPPMDMPVEN
jgi:hypothetical protein